MSAEIRLRLVRFGTVFRTPKPSDSVRLHAPSNDGSPEADEDAATLHANEVAVDIGGVCWGHGGVSLRVVDHHFGRSEGNFPCASAGVLHLAGRIGEWSGAQLAQDRPLWIVTHQQPDFDALCAAYLVREIVLGRFGEQPDFQPLGVHPDGWIAFGEPPRKIDWFKPNVARLPPSDARRSAILLAAVAARVDACRPFPYPRARALHAAVYAAIQRGRPLGTLDAIAQLFDLFARGIGEGRNPIVEPLIGHIPELAPEAEMLAIGEEAYRRDIRRARRAVVTVPRAANFAEFHAAVGAVAFATRAEPLEVDPRHTDMALHGQSYEAVDGVYLRDPECLLFKEYAREDRENSFSGQGFLFTAIVYSHQKSGAGNSDEHYFSLDPERAGGRHLYPLWAALQAAEIRAQAPWREPAARLAPPVAGESIAAYETKDDPSRVRRWFRRRAAGLAAHFQDPWWDGDAYAGTIVPTPGAGSWIGPSGARDDLSDDPVARIASEALEGRLFLSEVEVEDFSIVASGPMPAAQRHPRAEDASPAADGRFRFVQIELAADVDPYRPGLGPQIGRALWPALEPERSGGVPADFESRHLIVDRHSVAVWSRRGVAIAWRPDARDRLEGLRATLAGMAELGKGLSDGAEPTLEDLRKLQKRAARLRWQLALPESRPLARLYEAVGFHDLIDGLRERAEAESAGNNLHEVVKVQHSIEGVEVFVLTIYLTELGHIALHHWIEEQPVAGLSLLFAFSLASLMLTWAILRPGHKPSFRKFFFGSDGAGRWRRAWLAVALLLVFALGIFHEWNADSAKHSDAGPEPAAAEQTAEE